jgi:hypothetical protein
MCVKRQREDVSFARVVDWMIFFREKTKRKLVYRLSRSRVSSSLSASPLSTTSVAKRDATFAAVTLAPGGSGTEAALVPAHGLLFAPLRRVATAPRPLGSGSGSVVRSGSGRVWSSRGSGGADVSPNTRVAIRAARARAGR